MNLEKQSPGGENLSSFYKNVGISPEQKIIAIWGCPDPSVLREIRNKNTDCPVIDLDISYGAPESKFLPENYCRIITNIIDNAFALRNNIRLIVASVGEGKCDQGRFASYILDNMGFDVVDTRYAGDYSKYYDPIISKSQLPLKKKVLLIMDSLLEPNIVERESLISTPARFGFWGVPPNDLSLLDLFPDGTHVYGWTRCVESKKPADLDLEMYVDENVPTVFFAQTFCAKMQLAKYLAKKHEGLYVDVDDMMNVSVRAKIEAFLRLS